MKLRGVGLVLVSGNEAGIQMRVFQYAGPSLEAFRARLEEPWAA